MLSTDERHNTENIRPEENNQTENPLAHNVGICHSIHYAGEVGNVMERELECL